jgi:hypothetical protein
MGHGVSGEVMHLDLEERDSMAIAGLSYVCVT